MLGGAKRTLKAMRIRKIGTRRGGKNQARTQKKKEKKKKRNFKFKKSS